MKSYKRDVKDLLAFAYFLEEGELGGRRNLKIENLPELMGGL